MSLLYTAQGLTRAGHRAVVALTRPSDDLRSLYREGGIEVLDWPGITTFEHTTAFWTSLARPDQWPPLVRAVTGWEISKRRTRELVDRVAPDIVHLNSVVLAPAAAALRGIIPVVWHVREHPVRGHFGLRTSWLGRALNAWPSEVIFLSEAEKRAWVDGKRGVVVPNFVDLAAFGAGTSRAEARQKFALSTDDEVVLYVGGPSEMKGVFVMIDAIAILAARRRKLVCLMPGTQYVPSGRMSSRIARRVLPLVGAGTNAQLFERALHAGHASEACRVMSFSRDMAALLAASDVLAFPAVEPHFARPIVEAGAMGLPTVASRSEITEEQVLDGRTGLLTPPGDARAMAEALETLLANPQRARAMGVLARELTHERNGITLGIGKIVAIYDRLHLRRSA